MHYYELVPANSSFRGRDLLTYGCAEKLKIGQIVTIDLRGTESLGIVLKNTPEPKFKTKLLTDINPRLVLPVNLVDLFYKISQFYPAYPGATAQLISPSYLKQDFKYKPVEPTPRTENFPDTTPLNQEQQIILDQIFSKHNKLTTFIIHGETGSGKTRVYLELAKKTIDSDHSVVILTPEISLTAPLAKALFDVFGDSVILNHSHLSPKKRLANWHQARYSKQPVVLVGPRSTLFLPAANIGLIVIDEFHDSAYKQEAAPYYNGLRVASMLAMVTKAKLIMGSATPQVTEYFIAEHKNIPILRMSNQAVTDRPAKTNHKIIDLTKKIEKSPQPLLSNSLISEIGQQLSSGKQSLLFLNKRGSSRSITCQDCGWREVCLNCDLPMIYHMDEHKIRCHTCGLSKNPPKVCVKCGSSNVIYKSPGTKLIAESLSKLFPDAKVVRFDKDNKKSERMENNYQALVDGEADIIIGTQLVTKGHDLPKLGLVAMLQAESELDFPDFTSEERSYQLIKQLSGRVNRGHTTGTVLLQTFRPDSPTLMLAVKQDWQKFYDLQISQREQHGLPPFSHVLKIDASRKSADSAKTSLDKLIAKIAGARIGSIQILGPSPSFIERRSGKFTWQIIIKSKQRQTLVAIVSALSGDYKANIDPQNLL